MASYEQFVTAIERESLMMYDALGIHVPVDDLPSTSAVRAIQAVFFPSSRSERFVSWLEEVIAPRRRLRLIHIQNKLLAQQRKELKDALATKALAAAVMDEWDK